MATVGKQSSSKKVKSGPKDNILPEQDVLQAVIIAETFTNAFAPLSEKRPTALFPLVNCCLLDYALESLQRCGIQETYIFCSSYSQMIRSHVRDNWSTEGSSMSVSVISSSNFMSLGDAIRELDSKALIRSDFVLINGHVVNMLPLDKIMEEHKKIRKVDKGCAMTLIYKKVSPQHRRGANALMAIASDTKKIRFAHKGRKTPNIPLEVFQENEDVTVHYDIMDCHVSICSPCVPPLYSDNFDYQTFDDLVRGLIINEEVLCSSMYLHVASKGYAASVTDLVSYDHVSQDIMKRWAYPFVPDLFANDTSRYVHLRQNIYKDLSVDLHRNCVLQGNVVLGKGTTIGENTFIQDSIIGCNCHIGANVKIKGCYIWDNVNIADNCDMEMCLLADSVALKTNVKIGAGSVLSSKVVIGDYVNLPELTKILSEPPCNDDDGFGQEEEEKSIVLDVSETCDPHYVGVNGRGYLYVEEDESDDEDSAKVVWGKLSRTSDFSDEDEKESVEDLDAGENISEHDSYEEEESPVEEDDTMLFYNEVLDSLQRGIEEKIKSENLVLEINSSKYAYNVTIKEVNSLLMKAILNIPCQNDTEILSSAQEYFAKLRPVFSGFLPLMQNYIKNAASQMDCLQSIEEFISHNKQLLPVFMKLLHILYDKEIISELVIFKWYQGLSKENEFIKKQIAPFLKWLKEADEESSED